jgi:acylphosphatase
MKTIKVKISGTVQGVFFRKFVKDIAEELGVRGYVRNIDKGDIEIVIEGRDEKVNEMLSRCKKGPSHSEVKEVEVEEIKHQGLDGFKVSSL